MKLTREEYAALVKRSAPRSPLAKDMAQAFWIGGLICCVGQGLTDAFTALGAAPEDAGTWCSMALVFLGALLTGVGVYDRIARAAGAGTLVPITGFSNAVVSPALEFRADVRCIIRIVRENRDRRVSGLNPTKFIGKEVLEAAIIPHEFRLPRSQMGVADPSGSSFSEYYTHRRSYHATRSIVL